MDIFGKIIPDMVLSQVGVDGYESYHEMSDWGMDILKVGKSLGLGSIAFWNGTKAERIEKTDSVICKILNDGILYSSNYTHRSPVKKTGTASSTTYFILVRTILYSLYFNRN